MPGDASSLAFSINASDVVVGISSDMLYGPLTRGFLWPANAGMLDLLSLIDSDDPMRSRVSNLQAYSINDSGQIV